MSATELIREILLGMETGSVIWDMSSLFEFILGASGMTYIITTSRLMQPARIWLTGIRTGFGHFLNCDLCVGFWAGGFVYVLMFFGLHIIVFGFIGSISSYFIHLLFKRFSK
jgi:hypothetical protein